MRPWRILWIGMTLVVWAATPALAEKARLRYNLAPGQQWECERLTHMSFMVMGKKQVNKQKATLLYTVSKGPKKGWVHLSARYINPPAKARGNPALMAQYELTFTADMHFSGDTRNIQVLGADTPPDDPSMPPQQKAAMVQTKQMIANANKPSVFWFPELPDETLQPGDEFEDRRNLKDKNAYQSTQSVSRDVYILEEVSQGLAYFSTKSRMTTKMTTMGSKTDFGSSGKGDSIFDLKAGMWSELVTKSKMKFSGGMVGQAGQDMLLTHKVSMQLR